MDSEEYRAASVAFSLASKMVHCEPSENAIRCYIENGIFDASPFANNRPMVRRGLARISEWLDVLDEDNFVESVSSLRSEWIYLFVGCPSPKAPSWESYYYKGSGVLFGEKTLEIRRIYGAFGLGMARKNSEPDDSLGVILAFIGHVAGLAADALNTDDRDKLSKAEAALADIVDGHLSNWVPQWHASVVAWARSGFYRGVADYCVGILQELRDGLDGVHEL